MTTQTTTHGKQQSRQGPRAPLLMTALTLSLLGAFGLWQLWARGGETAAPQVSDPPSTVTVGAPPAVGPAEAQPWYLLDDEGPTWYLVGSQPAAEAAEETLRRHNKTLLLAGRPLPETRVLIVETPLDEQQARVAPNDESERRRALGARGVAMIDLRPDASESASRCGLGGSDGDIRDC